MSTRGFAHLHLHTEYSMLDGIAQHKPLMTESERLGMDAVAMTDHGNMFGAFSFYQAARGAGIKPILGIEAYVAPGDRTLRKPIFWGTPAQRRDDVSGAGAYTHMTLLAETVTGLRNLFQLSSRASIEGYYHKPRMDRALLAEHADGVIATTGCPGGEVQTRLRLGQPRQALQAAADYRDIFGPGNFFVEVMDHGLDIERRVRDGLLDIARQLGLPTVATNDSHYVRQGDADTHAAMLCVQSGKTLDSPDRFKFDGDGYYLKSPAEMRAFWDDQLPDACDNTLLIAERIQPYDEVFAEAFRMPDFPVPAGETQHSWLVKETWAGMARRFPGGIPDEHRQRVEYELGVIEQMGFSSYFLVVADIVAYAKDNGIRIAPGRGSATGCDVAYAIRITELDPIEHGLIFERFLNPERVTMPDIDLDFDERRRDEMVRYVTDKWGADMVCQIVTFGTLKSKAAIKDAARVLGYDFATANAITKAMPPPVMGNDIPLSGVYGPEHPRHAEAKGLRDYLDSNPDAKRVFDTARGLEGLIRQPGVHACGIILANQPVRNVIPVWRRDDGAIISGWDYPSCESVGLLKMDFLGLRNLTVIDDAIRHVRAGGRPDFDVSAAQLEDPATYEMLARGDTLGVFQLDGDQIRALLRSMAPTGFNDIAAVLALYRPGPMAANAHNDYADRKNGRQTVTPIHPELAESLAEILDSTYGLIVFQEQVLAIAQKVAGYSLGRADLLRRAMGKKKKEILDKEYVGFADGMKSNGYSDDAIKTLWDILLPFAGYAFNRSHTAGYGIISFWTAYLKANHPVEFMAALLTSVGDDKAKMALYLAECRRMGITVLPPDVNSSAGEFLPTEGKIRFGLQAIRGVGSGVVAAVVAGRRAGPYQSFTDFLQRVDLAACKKNTIEALIKAGAFDELGHTRLALMCVFDQAVDAVTPLKRGEASGQFDLFSALEPAEPDEPAGIVGLDIVYRADEWDLRTKLAFEREMLGLYVSGHPLSGAAALLRRHSDTSIAALLGDDVPDRKPVQIAGMLTSVTRKTTKAGKMMAVATIEDLDAAIELLVFPQTFELVGGHLATDLVVAVKGRTSRRDGDDTVSVAATDIMVLDTAEEAPPLVIGVDARAVTAALTEQLCATLAAHPGQTRVQVLLRGTAGRATRLAVGKFTVDASNGLVSELKALKGVTVG